MRRYRPPWAFYLYWASGVVDSIIKLAGHPGNLPFPASGSLAEHYRLREGRERLDILEKFLIMMRIKKSKSK